ncbi:DUF2975 domain-containing protein [Actinoplanes sp. NPDC048967]|uniref:DUF2975 domain-containing protein n=1 Tax=Actinoplanes sp. NPDC048967 TaxID=3155269 RepID=UPI0033D0A43E
MVERHRPFARIRSFLRVLILTDVVAILGQVVQLDGPATRRFDVLPTALPVGQPSTELRIQAVSVSIQDPTAYQTVLDLLSGPLPLAVGTLPIIWYALRLIDRITATQPFTQATATGLRRLGVVVLSTGAACEIVRSVAAYLLAATVVPPGARMVTVDYTLSVWWLMLGLLLLAFAQIIGYGRGLRAELDTVI